MVFTRKQYCAYTLKNYLKEYNMLHESEMKSGLIEAMINHIAYASTTAGICLQELGYITEASHPTLNAYLNDRGGNFATYINDSNDKPSKVNIMTFREFLDLLPNN